VKLLADCKLYTFVDTAYLHGRAPELVAQQLCDGGSDLIQLRAKNSSLEEIRRMHDRLYRLEAAVEDVTADLGRSAGPKDYREAFEHLYESARDLVGTVVEPAR